MDCFVEFDTCSIFEFHIKYSLTRHSVYLYTQSTLAIKKKRLIFHYLIMEDRETLIIQSLFRDALTNTVGSHITDEDYRKSIYVLSPFLPRILGVFFFALTHISDLSFLSITVHSWSYRNSQQYKIGFYR